MLSRRLPLNRSFNFPQKRFFATENAPTSKLKLTFTIPSGAFYKAKEVYLVKVPGVNGEMGLMANHVPTIAELKPGVVDVVVNANDKPDQYFISGGFAFMERDSTCAVSVIEAVRLSELDPTKALEGYRTASENLSKASTEEDRVVATAGIQLYSSMCSALGVTV